ncbi:aminoglycoside phosphotransferase (APT) family kinase protein [Deinococcus metalli]|uniref:Aminoglycoside phosphotransferase (APT) family kinase protein n=1 Tax=Deinococcus metalli TaxID=1141878 RepID=A0A7W8NRP2_9DEIO|nr:phosphotransferase [Deinococcus metalli]MBB5378095.1 aminoglycoside phosphotransferase (APT) family kinase protein [Deinococcus metalli]
MIPLPSDVDFASAVTVIRAALPQFGHLDITLLGEGSDHLALDVGGQYVVRVARRGEAAAAVHTEARLLAWLAPQLSLAVPASTVLGDARLNARVTVAGYPLLPGVPALLAPLQNDQVLAGASTLGTFLKQVHGAGVDDARALGLPDDDDPLLEEWARSAVDDLSVSITGGGLAEAARSHWEHYLRTPPAPAHGVRCVIHGDFAAEHVLTDDRGRPTGVIDWSDAAVGDPARDLAGLLHWGGEALLQAALPRYGPVDDACLRRAHWFAACRAVGDVAYGLAHERREYVQAGQQALTWVSRT